MTVRKSKQGKVYYSCLGYPDCKFMSWDVPTGDRCPECNNPLVQTARGNIKCSNKDCDYRIKTEKTEKIEKTIPEKKEEAVSVEEKTAEKQEKEKVKQEIPAKQEPIVKQESKHPMRRAATRENVKNIRKVPERPQTADERLREAFLKRLRALGGDYFEYYSVYLLERYSMKNGRRLEGLRISGGEHDGGIDGEIELTDRFGFKETIYIQAKNWDPEKGKEEYWVVGETLLQQFIGACACRQAKDGKQHCRGIFITTSRFTPDAKRILEAMSDKIVGYDGVDLYEAAKECKFGLLYENGNWKLDEKLLSGVKAFFSMM
jgi:restriction endonuclease Mrr